MQIFRLVPPVVDYHVDGALALQNSIRLIQGFADVAKEMGALSGLTSVILLLQCLTQGTNPLRSSLYCLPHIHSKKHINALSHLGVECVCQVLFQSPARLHGALTRVGLAEEEWDEFYAICSRLPRVKIGISMHRLVQETWRECAPEPDTSDSGGLVFQVRPGENMEARISLRCEAGFASKHTGGSSNRADPFAYAPSYPKSRQVGWWCILGDAEFDEVVAFKRATSSSRSRISKSSSYNASLLFRIPEKGSGSLNSVMSLALLVASDVYVGLDQTVSLCITRPP